MKELGAKKAQRAEGRETDEHRVFSLKEGGVYLLHWPKRGPFPVPVSDDELCVSPRSGIQYAEFWVQVTGGKLRRIAPPVPPRRRNYDMSDFENVEHA